MKSDKDAAWLTKEQAAKAIGVSTKTIEKLASEKKLHQATRTLDIRRCAFTILPT